MNIAWTPLPLLLSMWFLNGPSRKSTVLWYFQFFNQFSESHRKWYTLWNVFKTMSNYIYGAKTFLTRKTTFILASRRSTWNILKKKKKKSKRVEESRVKWIKSIIELSYELKTTVMQFRLCYLYKYLSNPITKVGDYT